MQRLALVTLVVHDYDTAIEYYVGRLGFELVKDIRLDDDKRWVVVRPDERGCGILLARAANAAQTASVGNQTGGRVALFLETDAFDEDYRRLREAGVEFCELPRDEPYGRVVVFVDLYGNRWDLIEPVD